MSNGFLTAVPPVRLRALKRLLTVERRTETQLDFLLSLKDESLKFCLSDSDSFGGLSG